MPLALILLLFLLCVAGLPRFGFHDYGYSLSGIVGVVVVLLLVLMLVGRI